MGVDFDTEDAAVAAALSGFANEVPKFHAQAVALNRIRWLSPTTTRPTPAWRSTSPAS